ncbi:SixA phosphatase family protein [Dyadobacter sandarakinus]|uniref:Histidine phosphatase family protein n=1 Tax=Dyadobacter sandarakinus TaxID=2747268 RepID=A0ABX7ICI9_9BACT|nr:histidine phosphatase family protein [Dyadobacter sandarakinus]QRR03695.1 histidine phosphatase family protein [Dyadobacter sandarakinus]
MKKTLILVRHATAEDQSFRMKDFDRNLNNKGLSEAEAMGKWMAAGQIGAEIWVTSPASRAYKTAEIMAKLLDVAPSTFVSVPEIYDGGPKAYLRAVNTTHVDAESVILFGHNPDITYFAEYLSGADLGTMDKGAVAIIEFEEQEWIEISAKTGKLVLYKTPQQVKEGK